MNPYVAVGITIGILAGVWTWASGETGLYTWAAFVSWALFFAAGGKVKGVAKVVPTALTGAVYGWLVVSAAGVVTIPFIVPIGVAIIAFVMCLQANWSALSFIPGAFGGAAVFFGTGGDLLGSIIALVIGAVLGWVSEYTAGFLTRPRAATEAAPAEHGN